MIYLEAPNYAPSQMRVTGKTIFLAGSITGAHDWQAKAAEKLLPYFNVANPRRANFDVSDPSVEREQITWEHCYLSQCKILLFHFSHETLAPITLLEYGAALENSKFSPRQEIYVSIDPKYLRKNDVVIQTELRNPEWSENIFFSLDKAIERIIEENT